MISRTESFEWVEPTGPFNLGKKKLLNKIQCKYALSISLIHENFIGGVFSSMCANFSSLTVLIVISLLI